MKSKSLITAALAAGIASVNSAPVQAVEKFRALPAWTPFDYLPERISAFGIPNPPKINQRKRRKQMRRVRPHGWKGGAA